MVHLKNWRGIGQSEKGWSNFIETMATEFMKQVNHAILKYFSCF